MQESFWWWQCSDWYIISLFPHLHTPFPHFSPSLISLMVSVDVKHHVYLLTYWLRLSARLVNRDKDLIATTDTHHRPVRVHVQRPRKGLQAKQSLRAQDSVIQKPDQNRNNTSHSLYNHPYALNHIQLVKWTFDNYEVNIFTVLAIIYHRFHVDNNNNNVHLSCAHQRPERSHDTY